MEKPALGRSRLEKLGSAALVLAVLAITALGGVPFAHARPGMHTVRLDGAGAVMVTDPQTARFDFGGGIGLGYELRPIPWLGVGARFSMYWFPSTDASPTADGYGSYYAPTLEVRGHPLAEMGVGDLWVGAAGTATITGDIVQPGIEVGVGYEFDVLYWFRVGPAVRYHHVFNTDGTPGSTGAGFVSFGLSLAFLGDPASDRDGDGYPDDDDGCPDEPEDFDEFEDENGCPDADNDQDGILDDRDQCPMDPEDLDQFEDDDGCPDPDNDQDGILDEPDQCPTDPEDRDGFADDDGCPDPDNDQDGILDEPDQCPDQAEVVNGIDDEDGCPDAVSEAEQQLERLAERIQFPHDRVRILASSRRSLRAVITLLQQHPEIRRIRIEAHASAEGTPEYNMQLSERRAQRVFEEMVRGGVAPERLTHQAFGDQQPDRTDGTPESEAYNRRVQFVVVERAR